jgi:hypothetical protein
MEGVAHVAAAGREGAAGVAARRPSAPEEVGEDVAEAELLATRGRAGTSAEGSAAGIGTLVAAPRLAVGVDLAPVVLLALLGVADDVVGGGNLLELLLGGVAVGRVQVGMQLLGELAVDAANLLVGRIARHAQHLVGVLGHLQLPIPGQQIERILEQDDGACAPIPQSWIGAHDLPRISGSRSSRLASAAKRRRRRSPSSAA